jgi:hypothetical protein
MSLKLVLKSWQLCYMHAKCMNLTPPVATLTDSNSLHVEMSITGKLHSIKHELDHLTRCMWADFFSTGCNVLYIRPIPQILLDCLAQELPARERDNFLCSIQASKKRRLTARDKCMT